MLGLPGNPVSALITAILFALPATSRLAGLPAWTVRRSPGAKLGAALAANDHRADHLRASAWKSSMTALLLATAFDRGKTSAMLRLLTLSDALIMRPPHAPPLPEGAEVSVIRLDFTRHLARFFAPQHQERLTPRREPI